MDDKEQRDGFYKALEAIQGKERDEILERRAKDFEEMERRLEPDAKRLMIGWRRKSLVMAAFAAAIQQQTESTDTIKGIPNAPIWPGADSVTGVFNVGIDHAKLQSFRDFAKAIESLEVVGGGTSESFYDKLIGDSMLGLPAAVQMDEPKPKKAQWKTEKKWYKRK